MSPKWKSCEMITYSRQHLPEKNYLWTHLNPAQSKYTQV